MNLSVGASKPPNAEGPSRLSDSPESAVNKCRPCRQIASELDLQEFMRSDTYSKFLQFIVKINEEICGKPLPIPQHHVNLAFTTGTSKAPVSRSISWAFEIFELVESWISEFPPEPNKGRFGNPSFRQWLAKVVTMSGSLMRGIANEHADAMVPAEWVEEVSEYFVNSFGNYQRIDYGTGHEANLVAWMYCLHEIGVFQATDLANLFLVVFTRYLKLMRTLQSTYWLEPAGSHGVWGLDDYHFLPFLWGSSQLVDHPHLSPKSIHDSDVLAELGDKYMYLGCIRFINSVKTASLQWHSPMLNDISGVRSWAKVNAGMIKMYQVEVLGKLPIMQHFLFGQLLPFVPTKRATGHHKASLDTNPANGDGREIDAHVHRGDCCGNPIPSVFAAAQDRDRNFPSIPFD